MKTHFRRFSSRKGLSLAEVLVSCLIVLIGISAILSSFLSGRLLSTGAKHWTQAMNVAQARIEYLKSLRYADLSSMPTISTETDVALDERDGGISVRCTRVTVLSPEESGITIGVAVVWNEKAVGAGSIPWSYQLRTWVSHPGAPIVGGG